MYIFFFNPKILFVNFAELNANGNEFEYGDVVWVDMGGFKLHLRKWEK